MTRLTNTVNVIVPVGALGTGVRASNLEEGWRLAQTRSHVTRVRPIAAPHISPPHNPNIRATR
jgi:hypothetical protein